jgi:hypothetical protein
MIYAEVVNPSRLQQELQAHGFKGVVSDNGDGTCYVFQCPDGTALQSDIDAVVAAHVAEPLPIPVPESAQPLMAGMQSVNISGQAAGSLLPATAVGMMPSMAFPAGSLKAGRVFVISAQGFYSTSGVAPGSLAMTLMLGSVTLIAESGLSLPVGQSNQMAELDLTLSLRPDGAIAQGRLMLGVTAGSFTSVYIPLLMSKSVVVDFSQPSPLTLTGQFSATGNTLTLTNFLVEAK